MKYRTKRELITLHTTKREHRWAAHFITFFGEEQHSYVIKIFIYE